MNKRNPNNTRKSSYILIVIAFLVVVLVGVALFAFFSEDDPETVNTSASSQQVSVSNPAEQTVKPTTSSATVSASSETPRQDEKAPAQTDGTYLFDLGSDVKITRLLPYTGAFMEDRTDEVVTDILAIQVTNTGEKYLQTMDITLTSGETQAQFSLSTLFPGETVVVLEKNRMAYSTAPEFEQAQTSTVALFDEYPGMCEGKLEIQCLDGIINVTNISNEDITGDILIYYKNYVSGIYYGGITYRVRISGGIKAGQIYQGTAAHFNPDNSTIVFVTCD